MDLKIIYKLHTIQRTEMFKFTAISISLTSCGYSKVK